MIKTVNENINFRGSIVSLNTHNKQIKKELIKKQIQSYNKWLLKKRRK